MRAKTLFLLVTLSPAAVSSAMKAQGWIGTGVGVCAVGLFVSGYVVGLDADREYAMLADADYWYGRYEEEMLDRGAETPSYSRQEFLALEAQGDLVLDELNDEFAAKRGRVDDLDRRAAVYYYSGWGCAAVAVGLVTWDVLARRKTETSWRILPTPRGVLVARRF
jgi:hypothetical protein